MMEESYRVYNRCKHDIGVVQMNGLQSNIKAGSFKMMSAMDIQYIESICNDTKFFASKMLVAVDKDGKDVDFEKIGIYVDEDTQVHMNDDEITALLRKSAKQIEAGLSNIDDPAELHAVYMVAKNMDLPASKLKILKAKIPAKEWLED